MSYGTSPVRSASLLTCLKEAVPADAWRPSYGDRGQTIYLARNLRRDLLLRLPLPAKPPDYKTLTRDFATPWLEIEYYGISATRYQHSQYGRAVCQAGVETTLSLLLDYPPEEKEPLLLGYVQYGIDLFGLVKNGHPGWIGDGGWGAGPGQAGEGMAQGLPRPGGHALHDGLEGGEGDSAADARCHGPRVDEEGGPDAARVPGLGSLVHEGRGSAGRRGQGEGIPGVSEVL